MKTRAGRRTVDDAKVSRRLQLVGNLRSVTDKSPRRFRIGLADNLFADSPCRVIRQPDEDRTLETPERFDERGSLDPEIGLSRTELVVGLAAIAGLTLGYLIGRRKK